MLVYVFRDALPSYSRAQLQLTKGFTWSAARCRQDMQAFEIDARSRRVPLYLLLLVAARLVLSWAISRGAFLRGREGFVGDEKSAADAM